MTEKQCSRCKETKPAVEFVRDRGARDGLHYYCKPCNNAVSTAWANGEKREQYLRKARERAASYYRKNKHRAKARAAVSRALKEGSLVREPCCVCGEDRAEAHHSSYHPDMYLAVTWLCREHHKLLHEEARFDD